MVAILFQMMQSPLNYDAVWLRQLLRIDRFGCSWMVSEVYQGL